MPALLCRSEFVLTPGLPFLPCGLLISGAAAKPVLAFLWHGAASATAASSFLFLCGSQGHSWLSCCPFFSRAACGCATDIVVLQSLQFPPQGNLNRYRRAGWERLRKLNATVSCAFSIGARGGNLAIVKILQVKAGCEAPVRRFGSLHVAIAV